MTLSICILVLLISIVWSIISQSGEILGAGLFISIAGAAFFVLVPFVGYSAVERTAVDDRFVVTYENKINSVTFAPSENKYLVEIGEGSTYTVDKVSSITDSTDQRVLKGYHRELPWVLTPYFVNLPHQDVYLYPLDKIEVVR